MSQRLIEVCDQCYRAGCWHGDDMCENAVQAGTVKMGEHALREMGFEHPDAFSEERLSRVYGEPAPHGYVS